MRHYEIVFIVHPDQSEQVPAMVDRYRQMVTGRSGRIHRLEDWGRRQLAYPIEKDAQGALRADEHRVRQRDAGRARARLQVQRCRAAPSDRPDERRGHDALADDEGREVPVDADERRSGERAGRIGCTSGCTRTCGSQPRPVLRSRRRLKWTLNAVTLAGSSRRDRTAASHSGRAAAASSSSLRTSRSRSKPATSARSNAK